MATISLIFITCKIALHQIIHDYMGLLFAINYGVVDRRDSVLSVMFTVVRAFILLKSMTNITYSSRP